MPKVLYIGSGSPWVGGAGYLVRQNMFLHALAEVAELDLAMFDSKADRVPALVRNLTPLPDPIRRKQGRLRRFISDWTDPTPRTFRIADSAGARATVHSLNPRSYDAVFAHRIDFAHFAGVLGLPRLLLDIDDPEHKRSRHRLAATTSVVDRRTARDVDRLEAFEKSAVAGAAVSFVCQPADAVGWAKTPEVVPNCVDVIADPPRKPGPPVVLFVGNCAGTDLNPNVDAVAWFLADIWPVVLKAEPAAQFRLIGAAGDAVRRLASKSPNTTVAGFVDDLAAEYAAASLAVAPIRFGTGTRIKILDAFAHAVPVVSTLAGAEGIEAIPGREIELAAGAEDFAARVVDLLNNAAKADSIGFGGHLLAARRYDRATEQKKLAGRLRRFLELQTDAVGRE
jgi:glycosyltransferase involved in cell wall biosynthesis